MKNVHEHPLSSTVLRPEEVSTVLSFMMVTFVLYFSCSCMDLSECIWGDVLLVLCLVALTGLMGTVDRFFSSLSTFFCCLALVAML